MVLSKENVRKLYNFAVTAVPLLGALCDILSLSSEECVSRYFLCNINNAFNSYLIPPPEKEQTCPIFFLLIAILCDQERISVVVK